MGLLANTVSQILVGVGANTAAGMPPRMPDPPPGAEKLASELLTAKLFEIQLAKPEDIAGNQVLNSLLQLEDGWFGADFAAPSEAVISDIRLALSRVVLTACPTAEVDMDGTVALVWQQGEESFALTFVGNERVIGSLFPQSARDPAWSLPASAHEDIAARLAERDVARRIS